ncbi:unnamed protein product, partial [Pleuronectes platessa]
ALEVNVMHNIERNRFYLPRLEDKIWYTMDKVVPKSVHRNFFQTIIVGVSDQSCSTTLLKPHECVGKSLKRHSDITGGDEAIKLVSRDQQQVMIKWWRSGKDRTLEKAERHKGRAHGSSVT